MKNFGTDIEIDFTRTKKSESQKPKLETICDNLLKFTLNSKKLAVCQKTKNNHCKYKCKLPIEIKNSYVTNLFYCKSPKHRWQTYGEKEL